MSATFVTATGTEIGKTFVTAGLIRHWRAMGLAIGAIKPVVSGYDPSALEDSDPGVLLSAMGRPVDAEQVHRIAPFRFAAPLSPDMAARRENRTLDYPGLLDYCDRVIAAHRGVLLIEGVGGAMAPLDDRHTVMDWMIALGLPLVVVTGSYLGSISHTLTCVDVLHRHGLTINALVVNETEGSAVPLDEAAATIARFLNPVPVVTVPRMPAGTFDPAPFAKIAETF
jgi:dethiobiotin synthetase